MCKVEYVALEEPPNQSGLPCEQVPRKTHLCVRPVCCTSREMWAGIDVHLGAVDDADTAEKTFTIEDTKYGVIATSATKDTGWANFKDASDHKAKTLAVWVEAAGYHPKYAVETESESLQEKAKRTAPVAFPVALKSDEHAVMQIRMRSELPILPPDFDSKVEEMAQGITRVRLLVDHGPNLGNQSAALSLIWNLRRAGYDGPIDALVDTRDMVEKWKLVMVFSIPVTLDQLGSTGPLFQAIENKLTQRYPQGVITPVVDKPMTRRITFTSDQVIDFPEGEDRTLARSFRNLEFAYTLSESTWNELLDEEDLCGTAEPAEDTGYKVTLTVELLLLSKGEAALHKKLVSLDPVYDQEGVYANVTWIKKDGGGILPAFDEDTFGDKTIVGMVAASEANEDSVETYRKDKVKTHSIVVLQPLLWHPDNRYLKIAGKDAACLCLPKAAAYFIDEINPPNKKAVFQEQLKSEEKATALDAVLSAVGACDLMVAYGVHQARSSSATVVLDNVACALAKAITDGHIHKTILLVLCKPEITLTLVHDKVVTADLDSQLPGKITNLAADKILFVRIPPVPQRSFQLLAQAGTLPFLLEGANTCNLMQMLGKPYLSVCSETTPYVEITGKDGNAKLQKLTDRLNESGGSAETRVTALATYFKDAKNAGTVLDGYFPELKSHVRKKALDEVKWGLYRLKKALEDTAVPSSEQCRSTS